MCGVCMCVCEWCNACMCACVIYIYVHIYIYIYICVCVCVCVCVVYSGVLLCNDVLRGGVCINILMCVVRAYVHALCLSCMRVI